MKKTTFLKEVEERLNENLFVNLTYYIKMYDPDIKWTWEIAIYAIAKTHDDKISFAISKSNHLNKTTFIAHRDKYEDAITLAKELI